MKATTNQPHSPAPWIHDETWGLVMSGNIQVCALHSGIPANAKLIIAAPVLLAVAQRLFHSVNGFSATFSAVNTDYACSQLRKEITETIREAQNAIAKATTQ